MKVLTLNGCGIQLLFPWSKLTAILQVHMFKCPIKRHLLLMFSTFKIQVYFIKIIHGLCSLLTGSSLK